MTVSSSFEKLLANVSDTARRSMPDSMPGSFVNTIKDTAKLLIATAPNGDPVYTPQMGSQFSHSGTETEQDQPCDTQTGVWNIWGGNPATCQVSPGPPNNGNRRPFNAFQGGRKNGRTHQMGAVSTARVSDVQGQGGSAGGGGGSSSFAALDQQSSGSSSSSSGDNAPPGHHFAFCSGSGGGGGPKDRYLHFSPKALAALGPHAEKHLEHLGARLGQASDAGGGSSIMSLVNEAMSVINKLQITANGISHGNVDIGSIMCSMKDGLAMVVKASGGSGSALDASSGGGGGQGNGVWVDPQGNPAMCVNMKNGYWVQGNQTYVWPPPKLKQCNLKQPKFEDIKGT